MEPPTNSPLPKDLFLLDPRISYLNHGSFGATPRMVFENYQWWQRELERNPVDLLGRRFNDLMRHAREQLAAYVHASAEDLVYVPNATTGLNVIARSLRLNPGDEVLTSDHEYGALDRTWRFICKKTGAVYKQQSIHVPLTAQQDFVEAFWSGVTPRTRVIFLSHITSSTALVFPVNEICRRAHEHGIISIIDGAHALGQIPLNLEAIGADVYAANAHKWLCAPKGSGFLHVRRKVQDWVEPLVVSWGYESERPSGSRFVDEQEWVGTRDYAAYLAVPEAIRFCKKHNWDWVRAECHATARYAREQVTALTELEPLSPDSCEWYIQMVSVPLPESVQVEGLGRSPLQAKLLQAFQIEVPIFKWRGQPYLRVSIQAYNSRGDVDRLVDALRQLLNAGQLS